MRRRSLYLLFFFLHPSPSHSPSYSTFLLRSSSSAPPLLSLSFLYLVRLKRVMSREMSLRVRKPSLPRHRHLISSSACEGEKKFLPLYFSYTTLLIYLVLKKLGFLIFYCLLLAIACHKKRSHRLIILCVINIISSKFLIFSIHSS